jgi:hypothetical protein
MIRSLLFPQASGNVGLRIRIQVFGIPCADLFSRRPARACPRVVVGAPGINVQLKTGNSNLFTPAVRK